MSAEYAAELFCEAIADQVDGASVGATIDEDLRSGGYFFDVELSGRTYEVLVVEFNGGQ